MTKILIADDQLLFSESLKMVLETRGKDIEVVFLAKDGLEAVHGVNEFNPDLVLMDINMPNMNGIDAIKEIRKSNTKVKILVLTTFDDDEYLRDVLENGANGFLLKDTAPNELLLSIYGANSGVIQLSSNVAKHLTDSFGRTNSSISQGSIKNAPEWFIDLSKREKEVLALILEGLDNREISEKLFIAEQTVKNHVSFIYSKMGVHDRLGAIKLGKDIYLQY